MNAKINLALLKTTRFDSGALGPLTMVLHQFKAAGPYHVGVHRAGRALADTVFRVDEAGPMQLSIDVANVVKASGRGPRRDCECTGGNAEVPVVSPRGYVLFHASLGDGFWVTVADEDQKVVFDSTKLGDGDLFAASLLEPGNYLMENKADGAKGEITVSLTPEDAQRLKTMETQYVEYGGNKFEPNQVKLISSQGLVFRGNGLGRIVISKEGKREVLGPSKPVLRWNKPVLEQAAKRGD
jgi:hypothetical protein